MILGGKALSAESAAQLRASAITGATTILRARFGSLVAMQLAAKDVKPELDAYVDATIALHQAAARFEGDRDGALQLATTAMVYANVFGALQLRMLELISPSGNA